MTIKEIIDGLKFTVAMFLFDPRTGETFTEPRNNMDKTTIDACKGAIDLLEQEPCDDCISRQAVLDYIEGCGAELGHDSENELVRQDIKDLPSVTPQPKTGHWIEENINEWSRKVFCSECGCPPPFEHVNSGDIYSASGYGVINKTKYCPNCGAKMVEPQESEG